MKGRRRKSESLFSVLGTRRLMGPLIHTRRFRRKSTRVAHLALYIHLSNTQVTQENCKVDLLRCGVAILSQKLSITMWPFLPWREKYRGWIGPHSTGNNGNLCFTKMYNSHGQSTLSGESEGRGDGFANYLPDKGLISRTYKEIRFNNLKQPNSTMGERLETFLQKRHTNGQ